MLKIELLNITSGIVIEGIERVIGADNMGLFDLFLLK